MTDVTTDLVITKEETFGPVAPLYRLKTEAEAIKHPAPPEVCRAASGDVIRSCASDDRARERKDPEPPVEPGELVAKKLAAFPPQLGRARANRLSRTRSVWYLRGWGMGRRVAAMALTLAGLAGGNYVLSD